MNKQRTEIYRLRKDILTGVEGREYLLQIFQDVLDSMLDRYCPPKVDPRDWALSELTTDMLSFFDLNLHGLGIALGELGVDELREALWGAVQAKYEEKEARLKSLRLGLARMFERHVMLRLLDQA